MLSFKIVAQKFIPFQGQCYILYLLKTQKVSFYLAKNGVNGSVRKGSKTVCNVFRLDNLIKQDLSFVLW